jgi:hypothetical protein
MRRTLLLAAVALVVAVNAVVLAGVAWNRSGQPEASLTLTERELPLAWSSPLGEDSGVSLRIDVSHWYPDYRRTWRSSEEWLVGEKLARLGFRVELPPELPAAQRLARRQLSRRAIAVLADGLARLEREVVAGKESVERLASSRRDAEQHRRTDSQLFLVDVGLDAAALRAAHPDRAQFLLLPAKVHVAVEHDGEGSACPPDRCRLVGWLSLLVDEVAVPRPFHAALPEPSDRRGGSLGDSPDWEPRYQVDFRVGSRHEPWIEDLRAVVARPKSP